MKTEKNQPIARLTFAEWRSTFILHSAQKMKFPIKDFFSKCDQMRSLR